MNFGLIFSRNHIQKWTRVVQTAIKQWKCEVFFVMFSYLSCYQIRLYLFQTLFGSYSCNVHESGDAMDLVWWGFGSCLICLCHPVVASSWLPSGTLVADIATENATENHHVSICFICSYWYGSIPINTSFRGMNIHLPAILMFTRGTRFWHTAIYHLHAG